MTNHAKIPKPFKSQAENLVCHFWQSSSQHRVAWVTFDPQIGIFNPIRDTRAGIATPASRVFLIISF